MYTSGWPKNQNKCWYNKGSLLLAGSKKVVLKLRSKRSIVIAAANTGNDNTNKIVVTITDQQNKDKFNGLWPLLVIFIIVTKKFIEPKILDTLAKCKEKMAQSTEGLAWAKLLDRGGYTVQPVLTLTLTKEDKHNIKNAGGKSQKLMLFNRGNAISGAPTIKGKSQLPKPLIITGITKKKIITKAWAVTITL